MYLFGSLVTGDFDRGVILTFAVAETDFGGGLFGFAPDARGDPASPRFALGNANGSGGTCQSARSSAMTQPSRGTPAAPAETKEAGEVDNHARTCGRRHVLRENGDCHLRDLHFGTLLLQSQPDLRRSGGRDFWTKWGESRCSKKASPFDSRGGIQSYTVLSLCRMLYTLEHGTIVSKPICRALGTGGVGDRWTGLIEGHKLGDILQGWLRT